jgi:nesprin-1
MLPTDTQGQLKGIRHNLDELNNLWQQLTTQVVDKQLRLDQALDYQQKYQDALQNISQWLDLAEQKIMSPDGDKNSQQQLDMLLHLKTFSLFRANQSLL